MGGNTPPADPSSLNYQHDENIFFSSDVLKIKVNLYVIDAKKYIQNN
jgi:hypothetical protein